MALLLRVTPADICGRTEPSYCDSPSKGATAVSGPKRSTLSSGTSRQLTKIPIKQDPKQRPIKATIHPVRVMLPNNKLETFWVKQSLKTGTLISRVRKHYDYKNISSSRLETDYPPHSPHQHQRKPSSFLWLALNGTPLKPNRTIGQSQIKPHTQLQAYIHSSLNGKSNRCRRPKDSNHSSQQEQTRASSKSVRLVRGTKRSNESEDLERDHLLDSKRKKFNEPIRNQHNHDMLLVQQKLEISVRNANKYGMSVVELENLLDDLDLADEDGTSSVKTETDTVETDSKNEHHALLPQDHSQNKSEKEKR